MKVHNATFLASAVSGVTLVASLVVILMIYNDVRTIWNQLDFEISTFRATTDDLWDDMMQLARKKRFRRQYGGGKSKGRYGGSDTGDHTATIPPRSGSYGSKPIAEGDHAATIRPGKLERGYDGEEKPGERHEGGQLPLESEAGGNAPSTTPFIAGPPNLQGPFGGKGGGCECHIDNKCPAGPPGPKGPPGHKGEDGIPGEDGKPGADGMDIESNKATTGCFNCPMGPQGPPGALGRPGPRGMAGAKGQSGLPGRDGNPGPPGEPGPPGPPGADGQVGPPGEKGEDAEHPVGRPGPKGETGPVGPQGPPGVNGRSAPPGLGGPPGPPGNDGPAGPQGTDGPPGEIGPPGRPGKDAEYCPCPDRRENDRKSYKPQGGYRKKA